MKNHGYDASVPSETISNLPRGRHYDACSLPTKIMASDRTEGQDKDDNHSSRQSRIKSDGAGRCENVTAMVPPWLPRALEVDSLDAPLVAALCRWLCAAWHSAVKTSCIRALARVTTTQAAARLLTDLPPKPKALLAAIVLQPKAAHHADVLGVLLLADDHMRAQRTIAADDFEGKADVARARAAFRFLVTHSASLFEGTHPVFAVELEHEELDRGSYDYASPSKASCNQGRSNVKSDETVGNGSDFKAASQNNDACVEEPESVAELRCRVAVLERDLAAAHVSIAENQRRLRDLDKMFEFWTKLVLSEMKSSAATEAAARAAMCESINRLATPQLSPSTTSPQLPPGAGNMPALDPLSTAAFCAALGSHTPVALDRRTPASGPPKRVFRNGHWVELQIDDISQPQHSSSLRPGISSAGTGSRSLSAGRSSGSSGARDAYHELPLISRPHQRSMSSSEIPTTGMQNKAIDRFGTKQSQKPPPKNELVETISMGSEFLAGNAQGKSHPEGPV